MRMTFCEEVIYMMPCRQQEEHCANVDEQLLWKGRHTFCTRVKQDTHTHTQGASRFRFTFCMENVWLS